MEKVQFIGKSGPQNEVNNVTEGVDAFKMFSTQELVEIICETNVYAKQCIKNPGELHYHCDLG
jgi:hypothetical protein